MITCEALGHPGATYNPLMHRTWCACGAATYDGNQAGHVTCCGGPLDRRTPTADQDGGVAASIGDILGESA